MCVFLLYHFESGKDSFSCYGNGVSGGTKSRVVIVTLLLAIYRLEQIQELAADIIITSLPAL